MKLTIDARISSWTGIGRYIKSLLPYLCTKCDVTVLTGKYTDLSGINDLNIKQIRLASGLYSVGEQMEFCARVCSCDVFWSPHYNIPMLPVRAAKRAVTIHDVCYPSYYGLSKPLKYVYSKTMLNAAVRLSHKIITVSDFSKNEIIRLTGAKAEKILMTPNGINKNVFTVMSDTEKQKAREALRLPEKYILYVGNTRPHKNLLNLIRAFADIRDCKLVIAGCGYEHVMADRKLRVCIEKSQTMDRLMFTDRLPDTDLASLYNLASALVIPSYYEGFGLPAVEAQACGCPVIASDLASLPEVGKDSFMFFDPSKPDEISYAIRLVMNNDQMQKELVKKGYENTKRFSWEKTAEDILAFIEN